jgi:pSer/pThr/pTyr-binding forkhead associated (FHA) protein
MGMNGVPATGSARQAWRVRRPGDLMRLQGAERRGGTFLLTRDGDDVQRIFALPDGERRATLGRDPDCTVAVPWDPAVSRLHAEVGRLGGSWIVVDDGLSRNGTFVNGHRVTSRATLADGDVIRIGTTVLEFHEPGAPTAESTVVTDPVAPVELTPAQRRVLIALARPYARGRAYAVPASNRDIAEELVVTVDAVKTTLRALFVKFGVAGLPQNRKRAGLVERALDTGVIGERDLLDG